MRIAVSNNSSSSRKHVFVYMLLYLYYCCRASYTCTLYTAVPYYTTHACICNTYVCTGIIQVWHNERRSMGVGGQIKPFAD